MAGRTAIGLDIGSSGVRAAELSFGKNGITLEKFGQVELPEGSVRDGEVIDTDPTSDIDDAPTDEPFGGAQPRPSRTFRAPRFDLPVPDATMSAPPERGRARPSGRDIPGRGTGRGSSRGL